MKSIPLRRGLAWIGLAISLIVFAANIGRAEAAKIERVRSPGGIEAWLVEDHSVPVVSLRLIFRGGGALDPADKGGLASMTASLLDEGAGDLDSQAFQGRLEDLSASLSFEDGLDTFGGSLRTLTVNKDAAFELLRLALTAPRFDPEAVERIRSGIIARLKRRATDPDYLASRLWWSRAFPDHPYGRPMGGTVESVARISQDDLKGFVAQRLARDTLFVGVVGDITPAELSRALDKIFGALPARAAPYALPAVEPRDGGEIAVIERPVPQSVALFGQRGLKRSDPDFYAAFVMNHILGGGSFSSRLYQEVREKKGLAYSISTHLYPLDWSALILGSVATQNARVGESIALIREEWRRMAEMGVTDEELAAAKAYLTGSYILQFDSTDRIARLLISIQLDDLGIDYIDKRNGYLEAVTRADIARVAKRLLDANALSFSVVGQPARLPPSAVKVEGVE